MEAPGADATHPTTVPLGVRSPAAPSLAVVILTFNEEIHIARAIRQVRSIAREIFVVDSHSTDRTVEIARELGATVLQNRFVNQAKQFAWGLDHAPITADWIFRLDADEVVEPDLVSLIAARLPTLGRDVAGVTLARKHIFLGRWIRHGGRYPLMLLRIWRRGQGRVEDRWMDEHVIVSGGRTVHFPGGFADHNLNDLTFFTDKHNKYATREALDVINQKRAIFARDTSLSSQSTSFQAASKRAVKEKIFNRMPFQISALMYFIYRYIFQLGFLDGKEGLIYHALQGLWYRFLVGAKTFELERAISHLDRPADMRAELARQTGLDLG